MRTLEVRDNLPVARVDHDHGAGDSSPVRVEVTGSLGNKPAGLSSAEVAERSAAGLVNSVPGSAGRSLRDILARNSFTWLNLILVVLGAASLSTGSIPDATFLIIAVINTVVGSVQEVRAKRTLEALSVVSAPRVRVVRDARLAEVAAEEVVIDELMVLTPGDQVVADATVFAGEAEVDESLATGESDPVAKAPGDSLIAGSWHASGELKARVVAVGAGSYTGRLAVEARRFSLTGSELMAGVNTILKSMLLALVVIGPVLFIRQIQVQPWRPTVRSSVAGLVGMIPEGLVLLTTLAFLAAALRLGRQGVLVQQLPAVEGLARVDALCTDKTGTITEGRIVFAELLSQSGRAGGLDGSAIRAGLAALVASQPPNATLAAIGDGVGEPPPWQLTASIPFSSRRKWSAASFTGGGTWVLGAVEMIPAADPFNFSSKVDELAARGARILAVAHGDDPLVGNSLPDGLELVALVRLEERIRADAAETLEFFERHGVTVRVVSGDSAATVAALAAQVGLPAADRVLDASDWPSDPDELEAVVEDHAVFGRVTPEQKRDLLAALRRGGHVTAMTGDGVNDTLGLKEADLGIAMGTGSAVARGVAQLVLIRNEFSALPPVVSEGRRVLHNIEAVAVLFLVKNVYSIVLSVAVAITGWPYPFLPRHLTLISGLAIGIPAFFLALAPSDERFQPGFVGRVMRTALPAGVVTAAAVLVAYGVARAQHASQDQARTTAVLVTILISLLILVIASRPLRVWKVGLVGAVAAGFFAVFITPGVNSFFSVNHPPGATLSLQATAIALAACATIATLTTSKRWGHGGLFGSPGSSGPLGMMNHHQVTASSATASPGHGEAVGRDQRERRAP